MPIYHRFFEAGHLQFITTSTYRRARLFSHPQYCRLFVEALRTARLKFCFRLIGWVLMPEHFHLSLQPVAAAATSDIVKDIKQRSAHSILQLLRAQTENPPCRSLLRSLRLPPTAHDHSDYRVWQRRFVPFNVYTEKKCIEKLDYMHANPVKRRLVAAPGD
jgi:putative transposase